MDVCSLLTVGRIQILFYIYNKKNSIIYLYRLNNQQFAKILSLQNRLFISLDNCVLKLKMCVVFFFFFKSASGFHS